METTVITNGYGLPYHPTDSFIRWSEKDPIIKMKELREAYDALTERDQEMSTLYLKTLLDAAYEKGSHDEAEANNPDL